MNDAAREVLSALDRLGIAYELARHEPVQTMADCAAIDARLGSVTAKNYFLTTKSKKRIVLCVVRPEARFHTADISRQIGSPRLSFGTEDMMRDALRVYPGAVSPLGLLFDTEGRVEPFFDDALPGMGRLSFHPCDNSLTIALEARDLFETFLPATGHNYGTVEIHDFMDEDENPA